MVEACRLGVSIAARRNRNRDGAALDRWRDVAAAIPSFADRDFPAAGHDHAQPLPGCA